jgi:DNA invertase Pin-like site-specific DNA recombinase
MSQPKALGYARLSQTSDTSIEDQIEEIEELANRRDFELLHIYNDGERSSGFDNDRPEYTKMVAHTDEEDIDAIIVRDTDRLSRDKKERVMLLFELESKDIEIWTTDSAEPVDFEDDEGFLLEVLRAYFDDVFKRREIEKAKRKIRKRIDNGYYHGRPPYGLQFDEDKQHLVPDGDEFEKCLEVIELRDNGCTYDTIVEETGLNRAKAHRIVQRREKYESI